MLFNSFTFILVFLPTTLAVFHGLERLGKHQFALGSLALSSLIFYGWWSLRALALLLVLMAANYVVVWLLLHGSHKRRLLLLAVGIIGNLAVLGYFKYINFFIENWAAFTSSETRFVVTVLPLGLSFFIFQKIALLVDAYRGNVRHFEPLGYLLFVSFFPQLIAGPIVHHSEVMPQFARHESVRAGGIAQGLTLFVIGLTKKVLIADTIAGMASPVFDAAAGGINPSIVEAWTAAIAYALQLYFDFSGYSDMAIGLALLFGIRLPVNFDSPYKAASIVEFWRCWHITLSRFLRDYLYFPLGGNRRGHFRRYVNLALTMLLGGLWHGAAWTFVIWGGLHAAYLAINHCWIELRRSAGWTWPSNIFTRLAAISITFTAVLVAWVFFRAADLSTAGVMLRALIGLGSSTPHSFSASSAWYTIPALLAVVWWAPNSSSIVSYAFVEKNELKTPGFALQRSAGGVIIVGLLLSLCLMSLTHVTEFLYFQF